MPYALTTTRPRRTLGVAFDPRSNSLNAIRLLLATTVIVSHSWPIGGYGPDPGWGGQTLGSWAVAGFFAISGYLITGSRFKSRSIIDYGWRRLLRIYPAFLAVLLLTAFVFAPVASIVADSDYTVKEGLGYVLRNLAMTIHRKVIGDTIPDGQHQNWNGSLWTLAFEFTCYIIIAVIVSVIPRRHVGRAVMAWFIVGTVGTVVLMLTGSDTETGLVRMLRLGTFFAAGAILYCYRDRIPFSGALATVSMLAVVGSVLTSTFQALAGLPVAYLMMYLGVVLPFREFAKDNDLSYGMYIYAFPVQQLLAMTIAPYVPVGGFAIASIAATLPFAWASWVLVERPAMRLKHLTA